MDNIAQRVADLGFEAPAVAVFGDVVSLRKDLKWYEKRPLSGKRIVVTRTRKQAGELSNRLRALGAEVLELPTIRIEPPTDLRGFAELVQDAHVYDWIVFTSPNGVDAFFEMFFKLYDDAREMGGARIAAIGPATAQRVRDFHLHVDLQPEEFVAEAVVREFQSTGRRGKPANSAGARGKGAGRASQRTLELWEQLWTKVLLIARFRRRATSQARAGVYWKKEPN